jgi:hypothetical protein
VTALAFALGAFAAVCAAHSVWSHAGRPRNRVRSFLLIGCPVGILLGLSLWMCAQPRIQILSSLLVYALICELYLFLFTLTISSVSANLLLALRRQALTEVELEEQYDSRKMVAQRLARLEALGLLGRNSDRLRPTLSGLRATARWSAFRRFFRHPISHA